MPLRRKEPTRTTRPKRLGVYLDAATYDALFTTARQEHTSATALVEHLIKDYLHRGRKGTRHPR